MLIAEATKNALANVQRLLSLALPFVRLRYDFASPYVGGNEFNYE
jgi:hypothetical protein